MAKPQRRPGFAIGPLGWAAGIAAYLAYLWLLPHEFGFHFERRAAWPFWRMLAFAVAATAVWAAARCLHSPARWRHALIGCGLPLLIATASLAAVAFSVLDHLAREPMPSPAPKAEWLRGLAYAGSALTYAGLCAHLCSRARNSWWALALGLAAFVLMLGFDALWLAWASGPHRLH